AAKQPKTEAKPTSVAKDTTVAKAGDKPALLSAKKDTTTKDSVSADAAALAQSNPLFAVLSPATFQGQDGQQSLRPGAVVGYSAQKDTAKVNAYLAQEDIKAIIPSNVKLMWGVKSISPESKVFEL